MHFSRSKNSLFGSRNRSYFTLYCIEGRFLFRNFQRLSFVDNKSDCLRSKIFLSIDVTGSQLSSLCRTRSIRLSTIVLSLECAIYLDLPLSALIQSLRVLRSAGANSQAPTSPSACRHIICTTTCLPLLLRPRLGYRGAVAFPFTATISRSVRRKTRPTRRSAFPHWSAILEHSFWPRPVVTCLSAGVLRCSISELENWKSIGHSEGVGVPTCPFLRNMKLTRTLLRREKMFKRVRHCISNWELWLL